MRGVPFCRVREILLGHGLSYNSRIFVKSVFVLDMKVDLEETEDQIVAKLFVQKPDQQRTCRGSHSWWAEASIRSAVPKTGRI